MWSMRCAATTFSRTLLIKFQLESGRYLANSSPDNEGFFNVGEMTASFIDGPAGGRVKIVERS